MIWRVPCLQSSQEVSIHVAAKERSHVGWWRWELDAAGDNADHAARALTATEALGERRAGGTRGEPQRRAISIPLAGRTGAFIERAADIAAGRGSEAAASGVVIAREIRWCVGQAEARRLLLTGPRVVSNAAAGVWLPGRWRRTLADARAAVGAIPAARLADVDTAVLVEDQRRHVLRRRDRWALVLVLALLPFLLVRLALVLGRLGLRQPQTAEPEPRGGQPAQHVAAGGEAGQG